MRIYKHIHRYDVPIPHRYDIPIPHRYDVPLEGYDIPINYIQWTISIFIIIFFLEDDDIIKLIKFNLISFIFCDMIGTRKRGEIYVS